jgi:predicted transcriptional regulator
MFFKKSSRILVALLEGEKSISQISRETNLSYSFIFKVVEKIVDLDLVEIRKERNKTIVKLTEAGREIASLVKTIESILSRE